LRNQGVDDELRREQLKDLESKRRFRAFNAVLSGLGSLATLLKTIVWLISR
jgi:hypothetical protein